MLKITRRIILAATAVLLSGWPVVALFGWWTLTRPSPIVLEGCREVRRPAGDAPVSPSPRKVP